MAKHKGQTDKTHQVKLPSSIERVQWSDLRAAPGGTVGLEIYTRYVGNGARLKIRLTDHRGTTHGTYKAQIHNDHLSTDIQVPPKAEKALYAEVNFSKHGLKQKSPALVLTAPVTVENAAWSKSEARRGDVLTLSADVEGVPDGTEATIEILEHDEDGAHDPVTELSALVEKKKVEAEWKYEYHEDTDDLPTEEEAEKGYQPPEYFFRVEVEGITAESGLLTFKDWVEIEFRDESGERVPEKKYVIHLADGSKREGTLDAEGYAKEENVPPGPIKVSFPDVSVFV